MKKRVGVYLPSHLEKEIEYLKEKYKVTAAQILLLGYKLTDRKKLEELLRISLD